MEQIKWIENKMVHTNGDHLSIMSVDEVQKAKHFHESFPMYNETPLVALNHLADFYHL